jgi:hypothetical protein
VPNDFSSLDSVGCPSSFNLLIFMPVLNVLVYFLYLEEIKGGI